MKIRRFVAKDMRTALLQIKEELGADAVIMSNKKIPEGVELMAAVDYSQSVSEGDAEAPKKPVSPEPSIMIKRRVNEDKVSLSQTPKQPSITEQVAQPENTVPANDSLSALLNRKIQQAPVQPSAEVAENSHQVAAQEDDIEAQFKSFTERLQQSAPSAPHSAQQRSTQQQNAQPQRTTATAQSVDHNHLSDDLHFQAPINDMPDAMNIGVVNQHNADEMAQMKQEMASIRQLLEHQLSGLMWQDMAQKDPSRALLVNRMMALGLTEQVADQIAGYVPNHIDEQDSWEQALALVAEQLNTTNNDIIQRGGVVALVGPTGVGKTTTVAKLAARFAQIHGADQVAMISTDSYRIAGFEQLVTYGRIIGCQVKLAQDNQSLDALLQQFSQKKLVLIDTAGMGQRDMRLANHLSTLITNARVKIRNYLVLSANTQQRVMQENVERFKKVPLSGCIYTKLDESLSVGEIISTSIQNGLPIGYLTDGQRVPEDIKVANAVKLVTLADKMSAKNSMSQSQGWNNVSPSAMNVA
ncbi:flagellar biosynthesis protein FlhF [Thalassotalea sp. PLHSN55]|uniref:flagellar biosynthesis protein FlhF n=1 Tax=Thalassotalea sp. PLHSN55 TaxID=3435888 RepID=UPI003F85DA76